jgi:hypothetical protein
VLTGRAVRRCDLGRPRHTSQPGWAAANDARCYGIGFVTPGIIRRKPAEVAAGGADLSQTKEKELFFFEKKNQKTFTLCVHCRRVRDSTVKSLLLLFFRKEDLPNWIAQLQPGKAAYALAPRHGLSGPDKIIV